MKKWILGFLLAGFAAQMFLVMPEAVFSEQSYQIKEITPAVEKALNSRRSRFKELGALKQSGVVGENNKGYVALLSKDSAAKALIEAENADRRIIYLAVVEQNGLPADALAKVEMAFAQVQAEKAGPDEKIQDENGHWAAK